MAKTNVVVLCLAAICRNRESDFDFGRLFKFLATGIHDCEYYVGEQYL